MKQLREESIAQVQHALADVLQEADPAFRDRARTLVVIAEFYHVSITDALLPWIGIRCADKEWSAAEWRHWCEAYTAALEEARREILRRMLPGTVDPSIAEMSGSIPDLYEGESLAEHMNRLRGPQ